MVSGFSIFFFPWRIAGREILERPTYRYAPTVVYMDAPALLETAPEHISWSTWLYTREREREREVYIYESWLRHALSYFSRLPQKRLTTRSDPGASDTPHQHEKRLELFFLFFLAGSHTQRERAIQQLAGCVLYIERRRRRLTVQPHLSLLIVNLARSWIFLNFVQIENDFPRKRDFQKFCRINSGEKENGLQIYIGENLFRPWITSYMMDVIQLTSLRNMNSIFFFFLSFSRPTISS